MYRLTVHMKNGNETYFYFSERAHAEEYRDARGMAANRSIKSTSIEKITFEEWRACLAPTYA